MKKFLASVGNAKLMARENGGLVHVADIRTLTESTLNFANTMEEVRAGQGAKLYGRFSHDSGLTVTLTDAMFDLNYIQRQIGAQALNNPTAFHKQTVEQFAFGTAINLDRTPQPIGNACGLDSIFVWVRNIDCTKDEDVVAVPVNANSNTITLSQDDYGDKFVAGQTLCLEYFVSKPEARGLTINANFIPAELVLILTTRLFAGDAKAPETGKPVGYITIKIPRFQLDGTFDLSMAMSAASTMSLAGTALAVDDGTCDGDGIYAEIVEVTEGSDVMSGLKDVVVDEDTLVAGLVPGVYGEYTNHISAIGPEYYDSALISDGVFVAGSGYITVYDKVNYTITTLPTTAGRGKAAGTHKVDGKAAEVPYICDAITVAAADSSN